MFDTLEVENVVENKIEGFVVQPESMVENDYVVKVDGRKNNMGRKPKTYNIHSNNVSYLEYLETLPENTAYQYGLTVKTFLDGLGQKTPKRVTIEELNTFVNDNVVKRVHIRGFYRWMIENNISGSADDVQRSVLIWLL